MAVGDKSHLNNYQRAPVYPIMPNSSNAPMNFRADALNTSIINPNEATRGNALNFSGDASTSAEPLVINRNPGLLDDSGWMSEDMDLTYTDPYSQAEKEQMMADRYANTLVSPGINIFGKDIGKQYGYTGQGSQSMAGINAPSNTNPGGGSVGGSMAQSTGPAPIPEVLISQDLTRRPQTGNIYSPDLTAYYDSPLFNYTGPGGVDEYTYGQGLRTGGADYSIFGTPTDVANPYYEGQFAPVAQPLVSEPVGPADGAINMNPVQLPSDLPQIEVSADVSMPGFVGGGSPTDLTYQQTIDEMGIFGPDNPPPSTTFPSPGDMTETDKQYQDMLNQSLMMDNQLMNQLDSSEPRDSSMMDNQAQADMAMGNRAGFPNNTVDSSMVDNQSQADMAMGDRAGFPNVVTSSIPEQGTPNPQLGLPVPEFNDLPEQGLTPLQQAARDASSNIDTRDFRFNPTGEQDKSLLQKWVEKGPAYQPTSDSAIAEMEAMGNQVKSFADKTAQVRNLFDETVINTVGSPNQFEIQRAEADANQAALDKQRYNTQINNPTADFSGYMRNYGSGFKEPVEVSADVSMPGFTDATPMQIASNAGQMEARNTNIFDSKREDSPFAKGPAQEIKNIFNEQQNYEVPASEMSPGEVGLVNGLLEGAEAVYEGAFSVDGSGTDRVKTPEESAAWDKYYSYKSAGIDALNKGEIDVKAFNELKGKAGSDTVINHFVDNNKNPLINNSIANTANVLYQAMDVITGDDTIKEGITDFFQQKKGVDDNTPLGSIGEEIAKAKKATQQRKEVQENIFTPGPMKFAAVASKPKPTPAKSSPAIRTSSQKNVISKPKAKPGGRAGAGATTNKYSSFARNYGGRYGL